MTIVGYAGVSSSGQSLEVQREQLLAAGATKLFEEKRSGTSRDGRQALEEALEWVREGDVLLVTKLDRLARSVADLHAIIQRLNARGAGFRALHQGSIDTTRPDGRLMLNILAAFAEFETEIRKERQRDGIAKAKAADREKPHPQRKYRGRKPTAQAQAEKVRQLAAEGKGPIAIATELGIGRTSVWRVLRGAGKDTGDE